MAVNFPNHIRPVSTPIPQSICPNITSYPPIYCSLIPAPAITPTLSQPATNPHRPSSSLWACIYLSISWTGLVVGLAKDFHGNKGGVGQCKERRGGVRHEMWRAVPMTWNGDAVVERVKGNVGWESRASGTNTTPVTQVEGSPKPEGRQEGRGMSQSANRPSFEQRW